VPSRRDRIALCAFALIVSACTVAQTAAGGEVVLLLWAAPVLVLALPLLLGRYPGERTILRLAGRGPARVRRAPSCAPRARSVVRLMERGGRLVGSAMAKRPPPAPGPVAAL
jgi:hypothetical protein